MDKSMEEQKSVISEAIDLKNALLDIQGMIREQSTLANEDKELAVPQSSLKLDNLRNTILDCQEIANQISKGLRLLA